MIPLNILIKHFSFRFSNHILPICLPTKNIDLTGRRGIIAGWGKTDLSSGHTGTAILRTASVPIISMCTPVESHFPLSIVFFV